MIDDDDAFLYGESDEAEPPKVTANALIAVPQPIVHEALKSSNGGSRNSESLADEEEIPFGPGDVAAEPAGAEEEEEEGPESDSEDSDDDIEIIMEQTPRSLDLRQNSTGRPPQNRSSSSTFTPSKGPQPSLTTEYTPRDRGAPARPPVTPNTISQTPPSPSTTYDPQGQEASRTDDGPDPSTLPPVKAPASHPSINPDIPGNMDGRSILEVDLNAMTEKPWRRPGSDLSDWFNYGFDEISWEAYCYRRRDMGDLANVLKANVLNFSGMPEDQLAALPPELRTMVMTGANAMMSGPGANPNMMGGAVGMNPMMDMTGIGPMNMGPMGMGMNGDLAMQMQGGNPLMQEGAGPAGAVVSNGTPEQTVQMGMQDSFGGGGPGMMGIGMGSDFGIQEQPAMGQQMYPGMEGSVTPVPTPVPGPGPGPGPGSGSGPGPGPGPGPGRGGVPGPFRGRGMRGRGFPGRARGRGMYGGGDPPPVAVRSTSPLPPGVPTGPRNANKYKDRDGNAPAVDGLDYGGTARDNGQRTPSGEPEERGMLRKRRSSPAMEEGRMSKRR